MSKHRFLHIVVPQGDETKKKEHLFQQFLKNLHQVMKDKPISLEVLGLEQYSYIYVVVPNELYETVEGLLYSTFPDCEISETEDYAHAEGLAVMQRKIAGEREAEQKLEEAEPEGEGLDLDSYQRSETTAIVKQASQEMIQSQNNHPSQNLTDVDLPIAGCILTTEKKDIYPLITYKDFEDDSLSSLLSVISKASPQDKIWYQLIISPRNEDAWYHLSHRLKIFFNRIWRFFRIRNWMKSKGKKAIYQEEKESFEEKLSHKPFKCEIKIAYIARNLQESKQKLNAVINTFYQFNKTDFQEFRVGKKYTGRQFEKMYGQRRFSRRPYLFSDEEIATLFHLPNPYSVAHVVHVQAKKAEPPMDLPKPGTPDVALIGTTNYHNNFQTFGIKDEDRRRHVYCVGKSGSGKSKLLELMIRENLNKGQGLGILDPHGDLIDNCLQFVPKDRIKDVVLFDPGDVENPIAFNPLGGVADEYKMQVTIGFIQIFKRLFGNNWTDRLEHVLRYTTLALLDSPNTTVLSILKMLTDKNYRQTIVSRIDDSVVKNFWVSEFAGWSEKFDAEAITPLLNKVGQFVSTKMIRNIIAQPQSKFDIREIMDNEKILFMKVSKGLLGEENSSLIGSMIITKLYQAAMERQDMKEDERKDFYFYVDEFQNFATDTFYEILSEARKYRLCLTLAHQYMGQLSPMIQKTVFGNCGTIINFRLGSEDSPVLEQEYTPIFQARDIINLGVREFYIKMSVKGEIREAFSGRTLTVPKPENDYTDEIKKHSRDTYCVSRDESEKLQKRWDEASEDETGPGELDVEFAPPII
jgi:hypothetical protein